MIKQKYIRLPKYNEIIIFPEVIQHKLFKDLNPISAGFCIVGKEKIECFGESISLGLNSDKEDTRYATLQILGWEKAANLI